MGPGYHDKWSELRDAWCECMPQVANEAEQRIREVHEVFHLLSEEVGQPLIELL